MASAKINLLGLSGSLRKDSFNTKLLHNAMEIARSLGAETKIFDLSQIPLYNQDIETKGFPDSVQELRKKIFSSNGLLVSSPEYNFSFTGVLKNAIDWTSRPPENPFSGKPVAIMGASPSGFGAVRSQLHLRQALMAVNAHAINYPQIHISNADTAFDEKEKLKDSKNLQQLEKLVAVLLETISKN
jgi:chromate reductase